MTMNKSKLIDKIFFLTRDVPSTDDLPDEFIQKKRLIKPKELPVPYGCPSLFDLKHHLFVMEDDSIAHHIQSCWLCQNISKRYQKKRFILEKFKLLFESYSEMFKGHKGWTQQVIAQSYALLLFAVILISIVFIHPSQTVKTEYHSSIFGFSLLSFFQFIESSSNEQLIEYAKRIEFVKVELKNYTHTLPVIADKDQIKQLKDMPIEPSVQKKDLLKTVDLWQNALIFYSDILIEADKIDTVINFLEAVRENNPNNIETMFGLGELYKINKQDQKAIDLYEYMIALYENDELKNLKNPGRLYNYAGWSYYTKGKLVKAILYYKKAIEIQDNYAKAHFNLAMIYKKHKDVFRKNANKLFEKSFRAAWDATLHYLKIEGVGNPRIPYTMAIFHAVDKNWDKCLHWLEESLKSDRWYSIRAENEHWFKALSENLTYSNRFTELLEKYHPNKPKSFINIEDNKYQFIE